MSWHFRTFPHVHIMPILMTASHKLHCSYERFQMGTQWLPANENGIWNSEQLVTLPGLSSCFNLNINIVRLHRTWLTTRAYTLFHLSPHAYLLKGRFDSTTDTINFAQRLCGAPLTRPANPPQVFRGEAFKSWRLPAMTNSSTHFPRDSLYISSLQLPA